MATRDRRKRLRETTSDIISVQLAKTIVESTEYVISKETKRKRKSKPAVRGFDFQKLWLKLLVRNPKFWGKFIRASDKDIYMFAKQLSLMLESGLSYHRAFTILFEQSPSAKIRYICFYVLAGLHRGERLAKLLLEFVDDLGEYFVGIVSAGERTGTLGEVLSNLADNIERQISIKQKVKSALTYPMLVIVFGLGITYFLFKFILPRIFEVVKSANVKLPFYTILIMRVTDFMGNPMNIAYLLVGVLLIYLCFLAFVRTPPGRMLWENIKLRIPVYGKLNRLYLSATFLRIFALTLESGTPMLTALEMAKRAVGSRLMDMIVDWAKSRLKEGARFSDIFGRYTYKSRPDSGYISSDERLMLSLINDIFPSMARGLINIGDYAGDLSFPIMKYVAFAEEEIDRTLEVISSVIEPLLILVLGFMIGTILLAVMVPMYQMLKGFS